MEEARSTILSPKSVSRLRTLFRSIDTDNSGQISVAELEKACSQLSLKVTKQDIESFQGSDTNNDQELDFTEFQHFYLHQLRRVFSELDNDQSNGIDANELKTAFEKLGFGVTAQEVRELLSQVDKDQDQVVDFGEFCNFFCSLPSPDLRLIVQQWATGLAIDTGSDLAPPPLPPSSLVLWKAILAGGVAGMISRSATAPLERIKILAQTGSRSPVVSTLLSTWRQSRWHGLFAGNAANCLRVFPFAGLVCLTYANIAHRFPLDSGTLSLGMAGRMCVGGMAGLVATLVTHPLDVVRARLTVQDQSHKTYRGITHALMEVGSKEGLTGLYKGVGPTLLAMVPFIAVQQSTYDLIKQQALNQSLQPSVPLFLLCGSAAGVIAQTSVYPLEVVRRRMQVSQSTGTSSSALKVLRSLTLKQLFSGLSATYAKVIPSAAISVLVRDAILGRLKKS